MTVSRFAPTWADRWDAGITWYTRRTVEPTLLPIDVEFLGQQLIRVASGNAEDDVLELFLKAAVRQWEHDTQTAGMSGTWEMKLSGFPSSQRIVLQRPPLIEVTSVQYYDADGDSQSLDTSPADFDTLPSGAYQKAEIRPLGDAEFPATFARPDAVTITYTAGYASQDEVPAEDVAGLVLFVGELYKQRSLSVNAVHANPSVLQTSRFWRRVYG